MESFDQSLKYLLQHEPADFIRFGLGDPTVRVLGSIPSGLPARSRDVDGAYLIARGQSGEVRDEDKRVVHVELHRRHQAVEDLGVDVAEAQIRLFRRERRRVLSQVWDLYGDAGAPLLEKRTLSYGDDGSQCTYQRVNLRALGWQDLLLHGPPALWSLVALTRDGATGAAIGEARGAIEARAAWSDGERADHLAVLWFVAGAEGMPSRVMQAYFSEGRLMESELYRSTFEKAEARGRTEGEAKAYAATLVRLLTYRMGTVDPAVRERIRAVSEADPETLKAWHDEALLVIDADAARRLVEKILKAPLPTVGERQGAA
jgi:hypothetical protein